MATRTPTEGQCRVTVLLGCMQVEVGRLWGQERTVLLEGWRQVPSGRQDCLGLGVVVPVRRVQAVVDREACL